MALPGVPNVPVAHGVDAAEPLHACPAGHGLQTRSLEDVGAFVSSSWDAHCLARAHGSALRAAEKDNPGTHHAHERSAVALPRVNSPCDTAHVLHAVHVVLPAADVKRPVAQAEHRALPAAA